MKQKLGQLSLLFSLVMVSMITCSSTQGSPSWKTGGVGGAQLGGGNLQSFVASLQQSKDPDANMLARKAKFIAGELKKDGKPIGPLQPYLSEMQQSAKSGNYEAAERSLWNAVGQAYNASFWKEVSFSSSDGFKVYAYLSEPKDKGKYPAVVLVHGGEHGSADIYQRHAFLLLKENMATLSVDYRGSSGHGEEYKNAADPAGKEIDDVLKAVEFAKHLPSTSSVGLIGSSHGAFISGNVLTRTPLVDAGVLNFGGYNFETLVREWQQSGTPVAQKKLELWGPIIEEQGPEAKNVSPIYNVNKITAPLLLIHGKNDQVVPYNESVNLYEEMKKQNKRVELKLYSNGPHGFIFKPEPESESAFETTEAFLKRNLK